LGRFLASPGNPYGKPRWGIIAIPPTGYAPDYDFLPSFHHLHYPPASNQPFNLCLCVSQRVCLCVQYISSGCIVPSVAGLSSCRAAPMHIIPPLWLPNNAALGGTRSAQQQPGDMIVSRTCAHTCPKGTNDPRHTFVPKQYIKARDCGVPFPDLFWL